MNPWSIADIPSQNGKLAVVTGATGGLGYETAIALARAGAEVLVTGRNAEKGRTAIEGIKRAVPSAKVRFAMLDLASLASIRAFAATIARGIIIGCRRAETPCRCTAPQFFAFVATIKW